MIPESFFKEREFLLDEVELALHWWREAIKKQRQAALRHAEPRLPTGGYAFPAAEKAPL